MGHNQKNANRAAAIAKNAERYKELRQRVVNLEKEAKGVRRAMERENDRRRRHELAFVERVEALERPLWRKAADWIISSYRRYFPLPPTDFEIVEQELTAEELEQKAKEIYRAAPDVEPEELDTDPLPGLEIVESSRGQGKSTEAERRAAELVTPPPAGGMATASLELEEEEPPSDG